MPFARKSAKPHAFLNEAGLYDYAVKALGRQMRSEAELRRLMSTRAEPGARGEAAVAAVIARLKEHGYLDDQSFAETYARLRQENEKLGARRVRQDLAAEGRSRRADRRDPGSALRPDQRGGAGPRASGAQAHPQAGERKGDRADHAAAGGGGVFDGSKKMN